MYSSRGTKIRNKPSYAELLILKAANQLMRNGCKEFYGFPIAKEIQKQEGTRFMIGYGTLYLALDRLHKRGFLQRRWEDINSVEHRPRRRFYQITNEGIKYIAGD